MLKFDRNVDSPDTALSSVVVLLGRLPLTAGCAPPGGTSMFLSTNVFMAHRSRGAKLAGSPVPPERAVDWFCPLMAVRAACHGNMAGVEKVFRSITDTTGCKLICQQSV